MALPYRRRVVGFIPARGGSKGIPRKNIRPLCGKPLIAWTIESALQVAELVAVVVSTDDEEIADVARACGAAVPFIRPRELARDDTPGIEPVLHALAVLENVDDVLLLQPTSPLRTAEDIRGCLELAAECDAASVVSLAEPPHHPNWMYTVTRDRHLRAVIDAPEVSSRQDLPPVYAMNGAMYYARGEWLRHHRTLVHDDTLAFLMPPERSIDIDNLLDWKIAELLLSERARP